MALSPMMQKYMETKKEYPDCLLFYRLGDFYELFFDDAELASKELGLTLTGKDCGLSERAPMCGVPFHAVDSYLTKLCANGHKVAIAEQMEDPRFAKGLVKREVIRVVTPGTLLDVSSLDETKNHYIASICYEKNVFGLTLSDVTTGAFLVTECETKEELHNELSLFMPAEIIVNEPFFLSGFNTSLWEERCNVPFTAIDRTYFSEEEAKKTLCRHFSVYSEESLGLSGKSAGLISAGAMLLYLLDTQKTDLKHITDLTVISGKDHMILDSSTRRNLELTETMREKQRKGTLLWVLDKTKTAMGARELRRMIEEPLLIKEDIEKRLDTVEEFVENPMLRDELREYLNPIYDLERLLSKISYKTANPRDILSFLHSIEMIPPIRTILKSVRSELTRELRDSLDELTDIAQLVQSAISDDPPISVHEGNIIREGFHNEVDRLRDIRSNGRKYLAQIEEEEREKTGIKTLKIKYNKVFGYYLEVTNSLLDKVPDYFIRKQTLTGSERYITPKLKELEDEILSAEEKCNHLEQELFQEVRDHIAKEVVRIRKTALSLSRLDALCSLSYVAEKNNYVRPTFNDEGKISIQKGRHPVIEQIIGEEKYISNDTALNAENERIMVITGPNMAGKSTYMRQVALIVIMAQIGSFVPAESADLSICDKVFTRVGASDDLSSGQSTFMVEMSEVANILRNAGKQSLLILDEIGRGTSTFDGMAIAWAVLEYVAEKIGAKALFATHYHELTNLEEKSIGIVNYCSSVLEEGDSISFLRKVVKGPADKSYGIEVARLSGVPTPVLNRAKELVREFLLKDNKNPLPSMNQMSFSETNTDSLILEKIRQLDLQNITPLEAINFLSVLKEDIENRI